MPRHLCLQIILVGLVTAATFVAWMQHRASRSGADVAAAPVESLRGADLPDVREPDAVVDPEAAVATILELRSQFGSVLSNSELDLAAAGADHADASESFDQILRATAGVPSPAAFNGSTDSGSFATEAESADHALAESLVAAAALLLDRARFAEANGQPTRHQRLTGLAALLRAEAAELAGADDTARLSRLRRGEAESETGVQTRQ